MFTEVMAVYEYKGLTQEGKELAGIVDAESPKTARLKLRKSGIFTIEIQESQEKTQAASLTTEIRSYLLWGERIKVEEVAIMTRQMATLLGAGLPLMEALAALTEQIEKPAFRRVVAGIREQVKEGAALASALAVHPKLFSDLYVNMVRAGEASGTLDGMLKKLADFLEHQVRLKNKIMATMTYPIFMLVVGSGVLFALITFVVPKVTAVFSEMHQTLPLATRILINVSNFMQSYWWAVFLLIAMVGFGFNRSIKTPKGRLRWDGFLLRSPVAGKLIRMVALSRFSRTLSTLLASGVPLLQSLGIVQAVLGNKVLADAIENARQGIKEGEGIAEPLKRSALIPPLVSHMIAVGERSGELEGMLLKVAEAYDNEVETTIDSLTSLLAPLMILIMGAVILFIVLAILVPLFELSQIVR
jgi:general secretion pathway protein F